MKHLTPPDHDWHTSDGTLHWRLYQILGDLVQDHDQTHANLHVHASAVERLVLESVRARRPSLRRWFRERVLWRLPVFGRLPS